MKPHRASLTAQGAAVLRALESERAPDRRVCFDPYARLQVGRRLTACGDAPLPQWAATWLFRRLWPGFLEFVAARTRRLDDLLEQALRDGVRQVVILGAGYDSRAYRYSQHWQDVALFEVDHPATQEEKQRRLLDLFGQLPANVAYVGLDLNVNTLADRLAHCGYDPALKTLLLWEGVTYYLDAPAVDATLGFVRNHTGPGSSIVFDFTFPEVINGGCRRRETLAWRKYAQANGEALKFGIPADGAADFLAPRGFALTHHAGSDWLDRVYFHDARPMRNVTPIFAIAHASVA
ncbi:Putative S-adenosyl-L-methionine-dependent methyltransferase [Pirellulimonas nuda]|uniref:S-adenosyl-L-methionine-dependent methyltransferase n=1 Tax=Pirellulimonas nuda TaxID=2528009 RepID=A0A518DHE5_9BACT|nr:SAM-dependent methyltransferase [Pirellulimonas nuda]QDU90896.1 Putative S-adenosyl-L-methionine-dependent methyltransferase [Pirellulimonas nuda]